MLIRVQDSLAGDVAPLPLVYVRATSYLLLHHCCCKMMYSNEDELTEHEDSSCTTFCRGMDSLSLFLRRLEAGEKALELGMMGCRWRRRGLKHRG